MRGTAAREIASAMTAAARPGAARDVVRIDPAGHTRPDRLRVAAYARISSKKDDQLNSYEAQMAHYTRFIQKNEGWQFVDIYADEGITGTSTQRREDFQRLMRDCHAGKIDRILVKSISRFCRNTLDCIKAVRELTGLGVTILFEKEGIDTDAMRGELILTAMSDFAQHESLSIAGNLRRGVRMRMRTGTYVASQPPLGYRLENGKLVVDEDEAPTVRWIFRQYLAGLGRDRIALALTMAGIPRKDGEPHWNATAIVYILTNERYMGDALFQKSFTSNTLPYTKVKNRGELDRYYYTDAHPPIVSREDFERVRQLMERRRQKSGTWTPPPVYPFSRKIVCGSCGTTYRRKMNNGIHYWVCRRHDRSIGLCGGPRLREQALEAAFVRLAGKLKRHARGILGGMLDNLYAAKRSIGLNNPQVVALNARIARAMEQNRVLADLSARGLLDPALQLSKQSENSATIQQLREEMRRAYTTDQLDAAIISTRDLMAALEDAPGHLDAFDARLFTGLVDKVIVEDSRTLVFRLCNGLELREMLEGGSRE